MPELICPNCKSINKCPSCTDYICVVCGEDLEKGKTMNNEEFMEIVRDGHSRSKRVLLQKACEYSTPDGNRLQAFYDASEYTETCNPAESLVFMSTKHFTSIAIMAKNPNDYTIEEWDEKLTDLRNYTHLMDALVRDMRYGKDGEDDS